MCISRGAVMRFVNGEMSAHPKAVHTVEMYKYYNLTWGGGKVIRIPFSEPHQTEGKSLWKIFSDSERWRAFVGSIKRHRRGSSGCRVLFSEVVLTWGGGFHFAWHVLGHVLASHNILKTATRSVTHTHTHTYTHTEHKWTHTHTASSDNRFRPKITLPRSTPSLTAFPFCFLHGVQFLALRQDRYVQICNHVGNSVPLKRSPHTCGW